MSHPWMTFSPPEPASTPAAPDEEFVAPGTLLGSKVVEEYWDDDKNTYAFRECSGPRPSGRKMGEFDQYSFLIVCQSGYGSGDLSKARVDIKSQTLRAICRRVIGNHEGISWGLTLLRIQPVVFFHYYTRLSDYGRALKSGSPEPEGLDHLELLLEFTRTHYAYQFRELEELISRGEITFELLQCIFLPGTILYALCPLTREPQAFRLVMLERVAARYDKPEHFQIHAAFVEAAGNRGTTDPHFGHAGAVIYIKLFEGVIAIRDLDIYPLDLHADAPELRRQLIARGRIWEALHGVFHKRYDGVAYDDEQQPRPVLVNSRIMIDRRLYDAMAKDSGPPLARNSKFRGTRKPEDSDDVFSDRYPLLSGSLSDEDAVLAPPMVYGFSLEDKQWLKFQLKHITEIDWKDDSFERLVIPTSQKRLIKGLVETQATNQDSFEDFIEGKGRGLVLNLFGPPGVRKTLSAEAASEHLRRPLYIVGAGDLGTSPSSIDRALTRIFKLGTAWRAVVLIDEADVYLEQRSMHDLNRNALVSVFLRQIEYFSGVLFLTTNRVRTFDEAFQSRIHVSLCYNELDADARRTLWRSFLDKTGCELGPAEEATLTALPLNGRQIKNAVRTATALAASSKEQVSYGHIKEVLDIMQQFEDLREHAVARPAQGPWHPRVLAQGAWELFRGGFSTHFHLF